MAPFRPGPSKMGFTPPRKVFTLDFTGTELEGFEVKVASADLNTFLGLLSLADKADAGGKESLDAINSLFEGFARLVRSWNLDDEDGQPVPVGVEGLRTLELGQAMHVIRAWIAAVSDVPAPLDQPSSGTGPLVVELPPMEPLSDRQAS